MTTNKYVIELTQDNFAEKIGTSDVPVLVDFWAPWCSPCNVLTPTLEEAAAELGGAATIAKVNIDENPELAAKFGIASIPTLVLFSGGAEQERVIGLVGKDEIVRRVSA